MIIPPDRIGERDTKNTSRARRGYSSLNVGHNELIILIDELREQYQQSDLLFVFGVSRSRDAYHQQQ